MKRLQARLSLKRREFHFDVAIDVPQQGILAIYGHSGSGKTTLLRCIAGLEQAPDGYVYVGGKVWQDGKRIFVPVMKRELGFVFQEPRLFPQLNVEENLLYGSKRSRNKQAMIDAKSVIDILGIGHLLQRRVQALSLGEQQRVAIGRTLLMHPQIILMDEPLASVDAARKRELLLLIRRLAGEFGIPVIYVSHALYEILYLADTLALMDRGKLVVAGPLLEVMGRLDLQGYFGDMAATVIEARVVEHDAVFALTRLQFNNQVLYVPYQPLAPGEQLRIQIFARNVSLVKGELPVPTSVLNMFSGKIQEIGESQTDSYSVYVKIDVGLPLLASITRKSLHVLDLKVGDEVTALIKAVSLNRGSFEQHP